MANAYPLQWPIGRKRTILHKEGKFKVSEAQATAELFDNLERMGATDIVVSSNRQPFSRSKSNPEDSGVAVYFNRKGQEICIACDKWWRLEHNLRAIGCTAEAMRQIDHWGTEDMVDAAFSGYAALPESIIMGPGKITRPWYDVLEVSPTASQETIKAAYKSLLHKTHPDHGGDPSKFHEVQKAFKEATS